MILVDTVVLIYDEIIMLMLMLKPENMSHCRKCLMYHFKCNQYF